MIAMSDMSDIGSEPEALTPDSEAVAEGEEGSDEDEEGGGESEEDSDESEKDSDEREEDRGESEKGSNESEVVPAQSEGDNDESGSAAEPPDLEPLEPWREHLKKYGKRHNCARCRYMANKAFLRDTLTYLEVDGTKATWLEEQTSPSKPWALGCSVCRNAWELWSSLSASSRKGRTKKKTTTFATTWARTEVRTKGQTTFERMKKARQLGKTCMGLAAVGQVA